MELRWVASTSASCLYASQAIARGDRPLDGRLAALDAPVKQLVDYLAARGISADKLLDELVPLAAGIENNLELAELGLIKACGRGQSADTARGIARCIAAIESAWRAVYPDLADELALRAGPLREQWEARGPGLLAAMARLVEPGILVEKADVLLATPVYGGNAQAHVPYNCALIEGVLANPIADLPEVVRLGWLLAQLNLDLPDYQGTLMPSRVCQLGAWALLPAAIDAAQEIELVRPREGALAWAVDCWRIPISADVLDEWWAAYRDDRPRWTIALAALDRMLA